MTRPNRTPCPKCGEGVLRGGWCSKCSYRTPESRQREQEAQKRRRAADPAGDQSPDPQTWTPRGSADHEAPPVPPPVPVPDPRAGRGGRGASRRTATPPPPIPIPVPGGRGAGPNPEPLSGGRRPMTGAVVLDGTVVDVGDVIKETVDLHSSQAAGTAMRGCLLLPLRLVGVLAGCLFAPLRLLLMPSLFMGHSGPQQERLVVIERRPFVVRDASGAHHDCYIRGELRGAPVRLGEQVRVQGRMERGTGLLRVARLTNTTTGATSTGHIDARVRLQPYIVLFVIVFMVFVFLTLRRML